MTRQFGPFVTVDSAAPTPWRTTEWLGVTTGIDGCSTDDLVGAEMLLVAAFGTETVQGNTRVGLVCGIVLLVDGRFVGWECPFGKQAVPAGYAYVGASFACVEPHIGKARRDVLRYCLPPDPPRLESADVSEEQRQQLYAAAERLAEAWMDLGNEDVGGQWLKFAANVMPPARPP